MQPTQNKQLILFDWKSSLSGFVGPEMWLQLGGYDGTTHYYEPDAGTWLPHPVPKPTQAAIVNIRPDKCRVMVKLSRAELDTALVQFRHCKEVFDWMVAKGFAKLPEREEYRVRDMQLPSVTYIIQHVIAKPGLMTWSYEGGVWAGLQSRAIGCTEEQVLQAVEIKRELDAKKLKRTDPAAVPWLGLVDKLHEAGLSTTAKRDGRAVQGSSWHKTILFYLEGKPVDLTSAPSEQVQMLERFTMWSTKVGLEPRRLETKVANLEEERPDSLWAGTFDAEALANLEA